MNILVTGAAGYIGTHTCIELIQAGFTVIAVDNLFNSKREALTRAESIAGQTIPFYQVDITDTEAMRAVFAAHSIDAVIHFAGLKAVGESVALPLEYYRVNVGGSVALMQLMLEFDCHVLLFSSSATVYGDPATVPITEDFPTGATNPYGRSKLMVEEIVRDLCKRDGNKVKAGLLRYFNPIGAHPSGAIGEDPNGIPNNLLPFVAQVAIGKRPELSVFGDDYPTPDGTGVRDYIHVIDLARGHVKGLQKLLGIEAGCYTYNLGTGRGYSVLEVVSAFERISERPVPYQIRPRRSGDIAECWANADKAKKELGWEAEYDLEQMIADTWRWQSLNPDGYGEG